MVKSKSYNMYDFGTSDIEKGVIQSEELENNEITIAESFLTIALEAYKQEEIKDKELIIEMIKVMLPASEEKAKKEWFEGLEFQEHKYYGWFATTGGMKKEKNGICETIFVREDFKKFAEEFEDIMSLGKFKEIENSEKEICINKDVLSRISLATSNSFMAGEMPHFIVLPQDTYKIIKDYKTVEKDIKQVENKNGELEEVVDYKLIDYHHDDDIDVFDGGGIASPKVFKQIEKELKVNYPVEFAIIRGYGLGIKGMITKFDIIGYLRKVYKGKTDYCRIKDKNFELLDRWNQWQVVTEQTILLNDSMVKLAKYYDASKGENINTYKERLNKVDKKYKDIINKLYITKINKSDKDITEYRRLNYQILTALGLSYQDYISLAKEDVKAYRKVLKAYVKDENDKWKIDIDTIRLFFKNIVVMNNDDEENEKEDEIDDTVSKWENRVELIQQKLINGEYDKEKYNECLEAVVDVYKKYTDERQKVSNECLSKTKKRENYRNECLESQNWSQEEDDTHWATIKKYKKEKYDELKKIDAKYILSADEILCKYDLATISNAIANLESCTEDFIINLFFPVFKFINDTLQNDRYVYVKDQKGDVHYLYEDYKKVPIKSVDNLNITRMLHLEEKKRLKVIEIISDKFRCKPLNMEVINLIKNNKEDIVFDIVIKDNQVILENEGIEYAEVFSDSKYIQFGEHSLFNCSQLTVANILKGKATSKSIGLVLKSISVKE